MTVKPANESEPTAPEARGLTRRQIAVGAAWAAPVIALAVATPAHAASVPPVAQPQLYIADASDVAIVPDTSVTFNTNNTVFTLLNATPTANTGTVIFTLTWTSGFVLQNSPVVGAILPGGWTVTISDGARVRLTHAALTQSNTTTTAPSFTVIKNSGETVGDAVQILVAGSNPGFSSAKTAGWASQL
jgi:hypothetical protein